MNTVKEVVSTPGSNRHVHTVLKKFLPTVMTADNHRVDIELHRPDREWLWNSPPLAFRPVHPISQHVILGGLVVATLRLEGVPCERVARSGGGIRRWTQSYSVGS
jgi:hypothetical protein